MVKTKKEAFELLIKLGAPKHLLKHIELVGEAADILILKFEELGILLDSELIRVGVVIHDIGKIIQVKELYEPGSNHEAEGEKIMLNHGVAPNIARICVSHAQWDQMDCSLEELVIALSDKLWKGKRVQSLELSVIDIVAKIMKTERWDVFQNLDSIFEYIASEGHDRLQRSIEY